MSTRDADVEVAGAGGAEERSTQLVRAREVPLGGPRGLLVRRTLPHRERRTVGAWCFADHFGPVRVDPVSGGSGMHVPPHPHIGLQTVTWLLAGDVLHRDSLGSVQRIRPGELNLMTAGRGIAHAEDSLAAGGAGEDTLHGLQLWVALPRAHRHQVPHFEHHADLPTFTVGDLSGTVLVGDVGGQRSPAATYSPIVGADLRIGPRSATLPLDPGFEHALLVVDGDVSVDGRGVDQATMLYLPPGHERLTVAGRDGRAVLLGGTPFPEPLVMWWNFVARDHDEIARARREWEDGDGLGVVPDYPGEPLPAPPLPTTRLRPRPPSPAL
jgi:redox-sensitive bicupin YhaK (pirin superfamily)